jgi:hypothetical protein
MHLDDYAVKDVAARRRTLRMTNGAVIAERF